MAAKNCNHAFFVLFYFCSVKEFMEISVMDIMEGEGMEENFSKDLSDEEALHRFLMDAECLDALMPWTESFNIFDVLKTSDSAAYHNRMLAWLLDPKESHGMGDLFLRSMIQELVQDDCFGIYDHLRLLESDTYHFAVYEDWQNMDLLAVSDEEATVIAIVNMIGNKPQEKPLNKFQMTVRNEFREYEKIFVCMIPDREMAGDIEHWDTFTYETFMKLLIDIEPRMKSGIRQMIRDYIEIIGRDIVNHQELTEICSSIYNKHKKALDLIFENRMTGCDQLSNIIREALKNVAKTGKIIYEDRKSGTYFRFYTPDMDQYLAPLDGKFSLYKNERVYSYCIVVKENSVYGYFELTGGNVTDEHKAVMSKMISLHRPYDKKCEEFRFKQLFRTKPFVFEDEENLEDTVRGTIENFIDELLIIEAQMLFNIDFMD